MSSKISFAELSPGHTREDMTEQLWSGKTLANADQILQSRGGGDLALYEEVLRDDQVYACFQQRILAQISREWSVEAGGEREIDRAAAEFIRNQLGRCNFDDLCRKMMLGIFYGYAVAECLWRREGDRVVLDEIKVRNPRRFGFDAERNLLLKSKSQPQGTPMPDCKFWLFRSGGDHDDAPYGRGLGYWLYWPVWFKRNFLKFWSQHAERFASPTLAGRHPPNISEQDRQRLLETLDSVRGRATLAIPENIAVEILETSRQVGGDYDSFIRRMDGAISKVILSQTLTTDQGTSHAQARVHHRVRNELVKADADMLCQALKRSVGRWLCGWKCPEAALPTVWRESGEEQDDQAKIAVDQGLYAMGYRLTAAAVRARYGEGYEQFSGGE